MQKKKNKAEEQDIKNAILTFIAYYPRKGFAWNQYNGGVYDPRKGCFLKKSKWSRNGVPDICGIWCGMPLFIEVKTKDGVVSDEQTEFIQQALQHGAIAFVCRDLNSAMERLNSYETPSFSAVRSPLVLKSDT